MPRRPEINTDKFRNLIERMAHNLVHETGESYDDAFKAVGYSATSQEWEKSYPDVWTALWQGINKLVKFKFGIEKQAEFMQLAFKAAKDSPTQSTMKIFQQLIEPEKEDEIKDKDWIDMTEEELTHIIETEKAPARFIGKVAR